MLRIIAVLCAVAASPASAELGLGRVTLDAPHKSTAPAAPALPPPSPLIAKYVAGGNAAYMAGQYRKALDGYERAVKVSSYSAAAWLDGAAVLEEIGEPKKAAAWYRAASTLSSDPGILNALGWAQWRSGQLPEATTSFFSAVQRDPDLAYAWLGLARVQLDSGKPKAALTSLQRAADAAPLLNLVPYYQGKAYEQLDDIPRAAEAYKQSVIADSYFNEGREALARLYMRQRNYNEAWRQFSKILDAEPSNKKFIGLQQRVAPLLTRRPAEIRPLNAPKPAASLVASDAGQGRVPRLRVGIGTNAMGKPKPRQFLTFRVTTDFTISDAATGKRLSGGGEGEVWQVRLKRVKRRRVIVVADESGHVIFERRQAIVIRSASRADGAIGLDDVLVSGAGPGVLTASRVVRGEVEVSVFKNNLRIVNILDLEDYTNGVVSSEMPIQSPVEALKAQAVIARSHALFIKQVTRRHRREGYDVCDGEHCQVYGGVRAESRRSREIVDATRGRIATYKGKVAHVIFSSNCGGFTQSGRDVTGWGDVPYWTGVADGNDLGPRPGSPWEVRRWLMAWPQAFCKPSTYVHPSHFRWTRLIRFKDLELKVNRKYRIGKLQGVRPLRRSSSGNVNKLLLLGSRRNATIDSEFKIRGLLGLGSLRSTLFAVETEYDAHGKPETLLFRGGGWGHGVGLCQSGAMGRAEAGQNYEEIIKAYFKGTQLGQLSY